MRHPALLIGLLAVAACGDRSAEPGGGDANASAAPPLANAASPRQADSAQPAADCAGGKPPAGNDDVLGVRFGTGGEEAHKIFACANPAFKVEYSTETSVQLPRTADGSIPRTAVVASAEGDSAVAYLMGVPGREKVIIVEREIDFAAGREPSVVATLESLAGKYGQGEDVGQAANSIRRSVVYSTNGRLAPKGSPDFAACSRSLGWGDGGGSFATSGNCGLTINYRVDRSARDPALVGKLYVIISDQDKARSATLEAMDDLPKFRAGAADGAPPRDEGAATPAL